MPVYVVLVLDKSGSMWGDKYNNATNASIELSKSLINKFSDNTHIALVQFSTKSILKRDFESSILTNDDFDKATGSTYVSKGLSNANDLFSNLKNTLDGEYNNTLKYTILLYDGSPSDSSYEIKKEADILKDTYNSKLITIGYEFEGSNDLKEISSLDNNLCNNSNYLDYCYYESNSSDINSLFDEIQNNISLEVEKTKVSKVNVNMKLNSYLKADINGELLDNISYSIDLTENEESEDYSYSIVVDDDIFNDCESKTCTKLIKLFDSITISEYDKDNNLLSSNENKESVEFIITNNTYSTLH